MNSCLWPKDLFHQVRVIFRSMDFVVASSNYVLDEDDEGQQKHCVRIELSLSLLIFILKNWWHEDVPRDEHDQINRVVGMIHYR